MKKCLALIPSLLLLAACQWMPAHRAAQPAIATDAQNAATQPVPRPDEWWTQRHAGVLEQVKQNPGTQLIFIGDSITHGWDSVPDLWTYYFGAWQPINMGFSGDRTEHVLWRLEQGSLAGIAPKAAVVMIGTNNSNGTDYTAMQIAEGVAAVVDQLRTKLPRTKVLLLAIFPRSPKPNAQREKLDEVNRLIATLADNRHVFFMDIGMNFLNPDLTLAPEIMPDALHPNRIGYQIWAISIKDKVAELTR